MPEIQTIAAPWPLGIIVRTVEFGVVAALFALSGAWSSQFANDFLLGTPFALLSVLLLVRNIRAALVFPVIVVTWPLAWFVAAIIDVKVATNHVDEPCRFGGGYMCGAGDRHRASLLVSQPVNGGHYFAGPFHRAETRNMFAPWWSKQHDVLSLVDGME